MSWSKLKQQLESFLCPALNGRVEYRAPGYRYLPDKTGICYISVDKKNVLNMSKSNFIVVANKFLSTSVQESIESNDILLNILALVDRRVGKKRILGMSEEMKLKHPIVQYFYELRRNTL
jgi:hypothetical protein